MADTDKTETPDPAKAKDGDPSSPRGAEATRTQVQDREARRDGTEEGILETEGEPAERYAEQERGYLLDPEDEEGTEEAGKGEAG